MYKLWMLGCLFLVFCQSKTFGLSKAPSTTMTSYATEQMASEQKKKTNPLHDFRSRLQVGPNYTHVSLHPHGHTTFKGNLGGLQGMYEYHPLDRFYGAAKLTWKEGETYGHAGKRSLIYVDAQERLGYTLGFHQGDWALTLYSGFGYRYYGQRFKPKEGSSLKFRYNEIYIPVGAIVDYAVNTWFAIGVGAAWLPQIYPTVKIVPLKGARWIIRDKLANFAVELPMTFTFTHNKRCALIFKPFYEYWRDGHTTAKTPSGVRLGIPGNTYNFGGAELNFAYSF